MINKKFGIAALAAFMGLGLAACGEPVEEIKQNDDTYSVDPLDIYLIGSIVPGEWDEKNPQEVNKFKLVKDSSPEVWTINLTVTDTQVAGWNGVKIHAGKTWDTQWGASNVDWAKSSGYDSTKEMTSEYFYGIDDNNIRFKVSGTYKFDFHRFFAVESGLKAPIVITKL